MSARNLSITMLLLWNSIWTFTTSLLWSTKTHVGPFFLIEQYWEALTVPILGMAFQPVSPCSFNDASNTGFSRHHRAHRLLPFPIWLGDRPRCQRASHPRECHSLTQAAHLSCHCSIMVLLNNTTPREKACP